MDLRPPLHVLATKLARCCAGVGIDYALIGEAETNLPAFLKAFETGGALNEVPGAYHLTARDVLTGATARATVKITAELR